MRRRNGFSLAELLVSVVILAILYSLSMKYLFKRPADRQTVQELKSEGLNPADTPGVANAAKERTAAFNKGTDERMNEYEKVE